MSIENGAADLSATKEITGQVFPAASANNTNAPRCPEFDPDTLPTPMIEIAHPDSGFDRERLVGRFWTDIRSARSWVGGPSPARLLDWDTADPGFKDAPRVHDPRSAWHARPAGGPATGDADYITFRWQLPCPFVYPDCDVRFDPLNDSRDYELWETAVRCTQSDARLCDRPSWIVAEGPHAGGHAVDVVNALGLALKFSIMVAGSYAPNTRCGDIAPLISDASQATYHLNRNVVKHLVCLAGQPKWFVPLPRAEGPIDELVGHAGAIAAAIMEVFGNVLSDAPAWYQAVCAGLQRLFSHLTTSAQDFLRNVSEFFIKSFLLAPIADQLKKWAPAIGLLGKLVIRWAFGFSVSQLALDVLLDASGYGFDKVYELFADYSRAGMDTLAAQGDSDPILGLILSCFFTTVGLTDLPSGVKPSLAQAIKIMNMSTRGSSILSSQVMGSISWVRDAVMRAVYGPLYQRDELFRRYPATAGAFLAATALMSMEAPMLHQKRLFRDAVLRHREELREMSREMKAQMEPFLAVIARAWPMVESLHLTRSRIQPRFFLWTGESGVGKSYLSKLALDICHRKYVMWCEENKLPEELIPRTRADFLFTYSAARAHFDGYNLQMVTQMTELFQFKATTGPRQVETPAFLNMASPDDHEPPMAHLHNKGIPFVALLMVAASNTVPWEWDQVLTEVASPLAFQRRITDCVRVTAKNGVAFQKQVVQHDGRHPDEYLDFWYVNAITGETERKITFVDICADMFVCLLADPYQAEDPNTDKILEQVDALTKRREESQRHALWHQVMGIRMRKGCRCGGDGERWYRGLDKHGRAKIATSCLRHLELDRLQAILPKHWCALVHRHDPWLRSYMLARWQYKHETEGVDKVCRALGPNRELPGVQSHDGTLESLEESFDDWYSTYDNSDVIVAQGVMDWFSKQFANTAGAVMERAPIEFRHGVAADLDKGYRKGVPPEILAAADMALRCKSLPALWRLWVSVEHHMRDPRSIPIWCFPLLMCAAACGRPHPALPWIAQPSMSRHLNPWWDEVCERGEIPITVPRQVVELARLQHGTYVDLARSNEVDDFCPLSWLRFEARDSCREVNRLVLGLPDSDTEADEPESSYVFAQSLCTDLEKVWIRPEHFSLTRGIVLGPHLAAWGDRYSCPMSPEIETLVLLGCALAAMGAVVVIVRTRREISMKPIVGSWRAQGGTPVVQTQTSLSLNDQQLMRSVIPSVFTLDMGRGETNAFAVSQNELICAAHTLELGSVLRLRLGGRVREIEYAGGRNYQVCTMDDLAMVRLHNEVLPFARDHTGKFREELVPAGSAQHAFCFFHAQVDGEWRPQFLEADAIMLSSGKQYASARGVHQVPAAMAFQAAGMEGRCGAVYFVPGSPHPLLGIHVAGGRLNDDEAGTDSMSLLRPVLRSHIQALRSSFGVAPVTVAQPEPDFLPHHADVEKVMRHDVIVIGGYRSGPDSMHNEIVPTPLFDCPLPKKYFPTPVENEVGRFSVMDPDHIGLNKWDEARKRPGPEFPDKHEFIAHAYQLGLADRAKHNVRELIKLAGIPDEPPGIDESLHGTAHIDKMRLNTAMGASVTGLGPTKREMIGPDGNYKPEVRRTIMSKIEDAGRGYAGVVMAPISRKVEKDKEWKVLQGRARLFYVVDGVEIAAGRVLFYRYLEGRKVVGPLLGMAVGSVDYNDLHELSKHYTALLDSDVTGQDTSIELFHLIAVYAYMLGSGLLGDRAVDGQFRVHPALPLVDQLGFAQFVYLYRQPLITYKLFSALFVFGAGNPSGGLLTWDINVLINKISYAWVYHRLSGCDSQKDAHDFLQHSSFHGGGDDSLLFLRGRAQELFSRPDWSAEMLRCGFVMTDPNDKLKPPTVRDLPGAAVKKGVASSKGVGRAGVSFLGRQWKKIAGYYYGALEVDRIIKIFQYCKRGELFTTFPVTFVDACKELRRHGRGVYEKITSAFPPDLRLDYDGLAYHSIEVLSTPVLNALRRMVPAKAEELRAVQEAMLAAKAEAEVFPDQAVRNLHFDASFWSQRGAKAAVGGVPRYEPGLIAQGADGESSTAGMTSTNDCDDLGDEGQQGEPATGPCAVPASFTELPTADDSPGAILGRAFIVWTGIWTPAASTLWQATCPTCFFKGNFDATRAIANFAYLRGTMVICAEVTSCAYDYGSGILWASPTGIPSDSNASTAIASHSAYLSLSQKGCAMIRVPFCRGSKAAYLEGFSPAAGTNPLVDWAMVGFRVNTPYVRRLDGTDPQIIITAWMEDVELAGPLYYPTTLAPQGPRETRSLVSTAVTEVVRSATGAAVEVAKILISRGAVSLVGALAAGMSKPTQAASVQFMMPESVGGISHINATLPALVLGDGPDVGRVSQPGAFGFAEDQTLFDVYARRPGLINRLTWNSSSVTSEVLWAAPCWPWHWTPKVAATAYTVRYPGGITMQEPTPCCFVAQHFRHWRGVVVFTFRVVKTQFHSGKLWALFAPGSNTAQIRQVTGNYTRLQSMRKCKWSIEEADELVVRVPYNSLYPVQQSPDFITSYNDRVSTTAFDCQNGVLGLVIETPLRVPSDIVDPYCQIEVYVHVEDSSWCTPATGILDFWKGPNYSAPAEPEQPKKRRKGKKRVEDTLEVEDFLSAQGGDVPLRGGDVTKGVAAVVGGVLWTVPVGSCHDLEAVRACAGAAYTSWRELLKRPMVEEFFLSDGYTQTWKAMGVSASWRHQAIMSTFAFMSGDFLFHFIPCSGDPSISGNRADLVRISRQQCALDQRPLEECEVEGAPSFEQQLHARYYRKLSDGPFSVRICGFGMYEVYPNQFPNNMEWCTFTTGRAAIAITSVDYGGGSSAALRNLPVIRVCKMCADNFDLGWQVSPPLTAWQAEDQFNEISPKFANASSG